MRRLKIGLNGFGRIGRAFARISFNKNSFDLVAINTRKTFPNMLAYLLKHDSVYRTYEKEVKAETDGIIVDGKKIAALNFAEPSQIPWGRYGIDVVVDATGAFKTKEQLLAHIKGAVKKVIVSAPVKDEISHVVLGVNDDKIDWQNEPVISNASCTTNCAAPMFKLIDDSFKIISGSLTTVHAVTMSETMLDDAGKSIDRSRAALSNIIPTTSGAAQAVVAVLPQLKGKIEVAAIRVPVAIVSFSDISVVVEKPTTIEEVNIKFLEASQNIMKGILAYEKEILVSSDFISSPFSCIFDANYTKVINGNFIKIFGWYDNEWGYSTRLVDLIEKISNYQF